MSKELKLRPEVYWFAQQMERKLREHDDRPGWHGENEEYLFYRLCEEVQELKDFLQQWWGTSNEWSECRLIDEAADVANFAMMLSDNARNAPIPPIAPDPEKRELVEALKRARNDAQWISVEERLPEEDVDVLIYVRWLHKESCITQAAYFDGDWEVAQSGDWISGRWITHWISLPSVP